MKFLFALKKKVNGVNLAVVKGPALSMEASGNLGAICYSRHRGLQIARGAWTGSYTPSAKRIAVQQRTVTVARAWSDELTEVQRQTWNELAKSQVRISRGMANYIPTGYQVFLEVNILRQRMGYDIIKIPHGGFPVSAIADVELNWQSLPNKVEIKLTAIYGVGGMEYYVDVFRAGPYTNGGRHAISGEYRYLKHWPELLSGDDDTASPGSYYWYKVRSLWVYGVTGNWFERQVYTV